MEKAFVVSVETEHHDRSTHERLAEVFIGCSHDIDLQPGAAGVADRADPSAVHDIAEDIEGSAL